MKNIYSKGKNPFAGKKIVNFKQTLIYPNKGHMRFQIQTDKNGQVCEIRHSTAQIIKDSETKKRFVKVILGERPRFLYDRIKGRPLAYAADIINDFIFEALKSMPEEVEKA